MSDRSRNEASSWLSWAPFLGASLAMLALCLAAGTMGPPGERFLVLKAPGASQPWLRIPAGPFILLFMAQWALSLLLPLLWPARAGVRTVGLTLLVTAAVWRAAWLPHPPSDDVNRYLWEGRVVGEGFNPYVMAPNASGLEPLQSGDPFHAGINHPDLPAAYPPLVLLLFAGLGRLWYDPMAVKILMAALDVGAIACLWALLSRRGLSGRWAMLYAAGPVALHSFAGQGHLDALQVFWLLLALVLFDRRRWAWMFLAAGLAVQTKYVAVLALPFLLRRDNWRWSWIAAAVVFLPFAPFLDHGPLAPFECLRTFGETFAFNGSVHALLRLGLGGIRPATAAAKLLLAGSLLAGYWALHPERNARQGGDPVSGCFFALGTLLCLSPTVHVWYLTWVLPFIALRPCRSWLLLSLTVAAVFVTNGIHHHTGEWRLPVALQVAEWLPFYALLLFEGRQVWKRRAGIPAPAGVQSVSVVVPAWNEEEQIGDCVISARSAPAVCEVVVVDGGSSDRTVERAAAAGARLLHERRAPDAGGGRGAQIRAGAAAAHGDVVAVVHADTRVDACAYDAMLRCLSRQPTIVGGTVGADFDAAGPGMRVLEWANAFRAAYLGIGFGDQVQFFRRDPVVLRIVVPRFLLMEDVELGLRLEAVGRQTYLFGGAVVSARSWHGKRLRRVVLVLRLVGTYLWKRLWGREDPVRMFKEYYGPRRPRPNSQPDP